MLRKLLELIFISLVSTISMRGFKIQSYSLFSLFYYYLVITLKYEVDSVPGQDVGALPRVSRYGEASPRGKLVLRRVPPDDQQHEEALHDGGSVSTLHLRSLEYLDQWLDLGVEFPVS